MTKKKQQEGKQKLKSNKKRRYLVKNQNTKLRQDYMDNIQYVIESSIPCIIYRIAKMSTRETLRHKHLVHFCTNDRRTCRRTEVFVTTFLLAMSVTGS